MRNYLIIQEAFRVYDKKMNKIIESITDDEYTELLGFHNRIKQLVYDAKGGIVDNKQNSGYLNLLESYIMNNFSQEEDPSSGMAVPLDIFYTIIDMNIYLNENKIYSASFNKSYMMKQHTTFTDPTMIGDVYPNKTEHECEMKCNKNSNCVGFLYDTINNSCQLVSKFINRENNSIQIESSDTIDAYSSNDFI
jgi:hypothetical protein